MGKPKICVDWDGTEWKYHFRFNTHNLHGRVKFRFFFENVNVIVCSLPYAYLKSFRVISNENRQKKLTCNFPCSNKFTVKH